MALKSYIYRVSFKEPKNGKTDYFFGSLSAIFTNFAPEDTGCRVTRLWNLKITEEKPYNGRKCTITKELVVRKHKQKN
ncbi:MAG: hypothetical protein LBK96_00465 [Prevotellaceae bacterium]|nr:hypothetical protein [Prevotellaceae bacterium]